jgi:hypothetical protein
VTKENKLREREVKLGDRVGPDVEILEGIREGDRVALPTGGQDLAMKDGVTIRVVNEAGESEGERPRRPKG